MKTKLKYRLNGVECVHLYAQRRTAELVAAVMLTRGAVALLIGPATEADELAAAAPTQH